MSDVLCMYYSRTGNTKKAMLEIATELNAEAVELKDAVERGGWQGWLRCVRWSTHWLTVPCTSASW